MWVIFPLEVPTVARLNRTYIVVGETTPPDWVRVNDDVQPLPLVVEISKSAGAVIDILSVKSLPETT